MSGINKFSFYTAHTDFNTNRITNYTINHTQKLNNWDNMMNNSILINNPSNESLVYIRGVSYKDTLKTLTTSLLSASLSVESRKETISMQYETEVSLCYKTDTKYIIVDKKNTINGNIEFDGLSPSINYYIIAKDPTNTYQDKGSEIVLSLDPERDAIISVIEAPKYNGSQFESIIKVYSIDNDPTILASSIVGVPTITKIYNENGKNIYKLILTSASKYYDFTITVNEQRTSNAKTTVINYTNLSGADNMNSTISAEYSGPKVKFIINVGNGIPDYIKYYHSTSTMNVSSMPASEATFYTSNYIADYGYNSIDHFIRFGVMKNGVETISPEYKIDKDPLWSNVIYYAPFDTDFTDKSASNVVATNVGSCYINSQDGTVNQGCLIAPQNGYLKIPININPVSSQFCIELYYKPLLPYDNFTGHGLFSFDTTDGQTYSLLQLTSTSNVNYGNVQISRDSTTYSQLSVAGAFKDKWVHLAVVFILPSAHIFVDGTHLTSLALGAGSITQKGQFSYLGKIASALTSQSTVAIQHLRITKGVSRYSAGVSFAPPKRFV